MHNSALRREENEGSSVKRSPGAPLSRGAMILALLFAAILLADNMLAITGAARIPPAFHIYFGSASLALAGFGYALLQTALRPSRQILWKRLLLAATFVAWAVDQLLPPGPVATLIGDGVIAAYVLDLFWITQEQAAAN